MKKESVAIVWTYGKFANYVQGKHIQLEINPKSLVPLLSKVNLTNLPFHILHYYRLIDLIIPYSWQATLYMNTLIFSYRPINFE